MHGQSPAQGTGRAGGLSPHECNRNSHWCQPRAATQPPLPPPDTNLTCTDFICSHCTSYSTAHHPSYSTSYRCVTPCEDRQSPPAAPDVPSYRPPSQELGNNTRGAGTCSSAGQLRKSWGHTSAFLVTGLPVLIKIKPRQANLLLLTESFGVEKISEVK